MAAEVPMKAPKRGDWNRRATDDRTGCACAVFLLLSWACGDAPHAALDSGAVADGTLDAAAATGTDAQPSEHVHANATPSQPAADAADGGESLSVEPGVAYQCSVSHWNEASLVADVQLCRMDEPTECVVTDAEGRAEWESLPPQTQLVFETHGEGYVDMLRHLVTPRLGTMNARDPFTRVIETELWNGWAAKSGVSLDPDKGHIVFFALRGAGGDVTLRPPAGKLVYMAAMGEVDPSLQHMGPPGLGVFFNVPPGEYDAVFSAPGFRCVFGQETGWPGATPDSSRVVVKAGFVSYPAFGICLPL